MPPKKSTPMEMETAGPSFRDLDDGYQPPETTSMFKTDDKRRMTSGQLDLARDVKLSEESTRARNELKGGVPVAQFVSTFAKIEDVKINENDPEVKKFMSALRILCDKIAKAERMIFTVEEQKNTRTSTLPFVLLQLKGSQDLVDQFINAPRLVGGYYSYLVTVNDLFFPKSSGFRMKLYECDSTEELKSRFWNMASEVVADDLIKANVVNLQGLFSALSPNWLSPKPGEKASKDELRGWVDTTSELAIKSQAAGLDFIQSVEEMKNWTLETLIEYCSKWGEKARLCHVLGMDHLRPCQLVIVGGNGSLRCLETSFSIEENRHVVERIPLPAWAQHWKVYTGGRSWSSASGGFSGEGAYKRPAPARGNYHGFAPKRGSFNGRGARRGRY